jgi:hypothetical protein
MEGFSGPNFPYFTHLLTKKPEGRNVLACKIEVITINKSSCDML